MGSRCPESIIPSMEEHVHPIPLTIVITLTTLFLVAYAGAWVLFLKVKRAWYTWIGIVSAVLVIPEEVLRIAIMIWRNDLEPNVFQDLSSYRILLNGINGVLFAFAFFSLAVALYRKNKRRNEELTPSEKL